MRRTWLCANAATLYKQDVFIQGRGRSRKKVNVNKKGVQTTVCTPFLNEDYFVE